MMYLNWQRREGEEIHGAGDLACEYVRVLGQVSFSFHFFPSRPILRTVPRGINTTTPAANDVVHLTWDQSFERTFDADPLAFSSTCPPTLSPISSHRLL